MKLIRCYEQRRSVALAFAQRMWRSSQTQTKVSYIHDFRNDVAGLSESSSGDGRSKSVAAKSAGTCTP